ncbi:MAG: hypothetical protein H0W63_07730 [Gemmatimonadaceae bacterium]|nr:hypothetical protein [Gemmatimonadaceae bacterium]
MRYKYLNRFGAIGLLSVAACSAASISTYPSSSATQPTGYVRPPKLSGELTQPLANYSGDDLMTFVKGTKMGGGNTQRRKCRSFFSCLGGFGKTPVTITATADAKYLDSKDPGTYGTIAAVVDRIHEDTDGYPFLKNDTYLFIVYPATSTRVATWVLAQLEKSGSSYSQSTVANGAFHECTPKARLWWAGSSADFQECGKVRHPPPAVQKMDMLGFGGLKVIFSNLALFYGGDDSAWVTCASGCCTMDAT